MCVIKGVVNRNTVNKRLSVVCYASVIFLRNVVISEKKLVLHIFQGVLIFFLKNNQPLIIKYSANVKSFIVKHVSRFSFLWVKTLKHFSILKTQRSHTSTRYIHCE